MSTPTIAVVLVAYGPSPTLRRCATALCASIDALLDIVIVDNGCDPATLDSVRDLPGVRVVGPPANRGFAGGCNVGVEAAEGDVVALVNTDAYVEPTAIAELVTALSDPQVGIVMASLRLADEPHLMNSAGNEVHLSGMSWVGAFREPAAAHAEAVDITVASGAAMALHRTLWDELGGFDEVAFAYLEDTELSLRCWMAGRHVRLAPRSVVLHDYDFGRNAAKFHLVERNRWLLVLTLFQCRTLLLLAPILLVVQFAVLAQATAGGWLRDKLRADLWVLRNLEHVRARRRLVQESRRVDDRDLAHLLTPSITPGNIELPPGTGFANRAFRGYWHLVRRLL